MFTQAGACGRGRGREFAGAADKVAEALVANFTGVCPIYGSLSRGAPLAVEVRGLPVA